MGGNRFIQNFFDRQPNADIRISPKDNYITFQIMLVQPPDQKTVELLLPLWKLQSKKFDLKEDLRTLNDEVRKSIHNMRKFFPLMVSEISYRDEAQKLIQCQQRKITNLNFKLVQFSRELKQLLEFYMKNMHGEHSGNNEVYLAQTNSMDEESTLLFALVMSDILRGDVRDLKDNCSDLFDDMLNWESQLVSFLRKNLICQ